MRALDYAIEERRSNADRRWFFVDPDKMYPAALRYVQDAIRNKIKAHPATLSDLGIAPLIPDKGFAMAAAARDKVPEEWTLHRRMALECARLCFTSLLREELGEPIGVHIGKSDHWRL